MLGASAPAARVRNPLALLASKLELLDRAGRQLREESFETLEGVQSSQYTDDGNQLNTAARLETLDGALADGRPLGKLGLGQACFDAVSLDPFTQDLGDRCIRQIGRNAHKSSLMATKVANRA